MSVQEHISALHDRILILEATKADHDVRVPNLENGVADANGITTTASGLTYEVIGNGQGATPLLQDQVKVHYKGYFLDGKVFDSSYDRGEPATFPLKAVIKGWTEVLQLMKEGDIWKVTIPANLAYGERGNAGIPGNSVLVFDIELIEVIK